MLIGGLVGVRVGDWEEGVAGPMGSSGQSLEALPLLLPLSLSGVPCLPA